MNFRPQQREGIDINLTPLIDVVFLLLIFFMVSTTFDRYSDLKIELPQASIEPTDQVDKSIEIAIDKEGRFFINRKEVINAESVTVQAAIRKVLGERNSLPVVVRADANTPHQAVITALDAAAKLGLTRISIATSQDAAKP